VKLARSLTGADPSGGACAVPATNPAPVTCTWHDAAGAHTDTGFAPCWQHMDVRLALVQDTSNRSWPVDDWNGDGIAGTGDHWPASRFAAEDLRCPDGGAGVVGTQVDWTCDGALTTADQTHRVYAGFLGELGTALLNDFGPASAQHVFVSPKPLEFGAACAAYSESACSHHATRTPTPARPFDHFYHPWVY
jgi:hypothetical protein